MMKKILAYVLVLTLVLGMLPATAMAVETANTTEGYQVGYSKVDINPYWQAYIDADPENRTLPEGYGYSNTYDMLPLPMGGYGTNKYRLSRAKLVDDNGSGYGLKTYNLAENKISYDPNATVVHLSDNRYSKEFAISLFGEDSDAYNAYKTWANIESDTDWGDNDGDGLWTTAVYIEDSTGSPLLILGVDNIGVKAELIQEAKDKILEACKESCPGLTADRILINSNHTHGGPALGEGYSSTGTTKYYFWEGNTSFKIGSSTFDVEPGPGFSSADMYSYLEFYKSYLTDKLSEAAAAAVADRKAADNMYKGSIDAGDETGMIINGVRHNKQTFQEGNKPVLEYVRGSSFNVDLNGNGSGDRFRNSDNTENSWTETIDGVTYTWTKAEAVTEADDMLHLLAFTFDEDISIKPVVLVNWRAHSTANNKQAAKDLHYNLSADWGASLRYELEQIGCRASLLYGSSGNLGTGESGAAEEDKAITSDRPYFMTDENLASLGISNEGIKRYMMPGVYYGKQVARAALALLEGMGDDNIVPMGPIRSLQKYELQEKRDWPITYYYAAKAHNELIKTESVQYPWVYKSSAADYSTYDENGTVVRVSEDDNTPVVIASQYHATHVINKYESSAQSFIELNAVTLGSQVAFATTPVEASDRYFYYTDENDLDTAKESNLWTNLSRGDDSWGTPFVLSLTNGSHGYVPNMYAYDYNFDYYNRAVPGETGKTFGDYYTIAIGSYESQSAWADRGEGERMVEVLSSMLTTLENNAEPKEQTFFCTYCGREETFAPLIPGHFQADDTLHNGHYYLADDFSSRQGITIAKDEFVCLELNGKTFYSGQKAFMVSGTLSVQDSSTNGSGVLKGRAVNKANGGTLSVQGGGVVNQYGGNFVCEQVADVAITDGGVVYVGDHGVFNMYGGTVSGGKASSFGGNVSAQHSGEVGGTFNMYGGTITGGSAGSASYANLMVSGKSFFRYVGGTIPSGAFMQGTMYLGDPEGYRADTSEIATVQLRNSGTVTLDGIFTGNVKLDYSNTKNEAYSTSPANGSTIGAVVPGSWIDYVNGAKISATNTSSYEGVVDGELLKLGTKPATSYCSVCETNVVWMPMVSGAVNGHFALESDLSGMAEQTIPDYAKLCLDLKGNTYTASARAFTVNGTLNIQDTGSNGTLKGTAVAGKNGSTIYVAANGKVNQYGGTLTSDNSNGKPTSGGVVYVVARGTYDLYNGIITGGKASTAGGNVYNCGTFTLHSGTISRGSASSYGANIHTQGASATFNMLGGTVTGSSSSSICTGPNATTDTSTFYMAGGKVDGGGKILVQGKAVLTGDGTVTMTVKQPHERLTIEGKYTGILNLTLSSTDTTYTAGSKIGISDNANISGASITVEGHTDKEVAVVGDELRLAVPVTLESISVKTNPTKTASRKGEALNDTGLVLEATYSDGSTEEITEGFTLSGYDPNTVGDQTVTVTYEDKTATFTVTVAEVTADFVVNGVGYDDLDAAIAASSAEYPVVLYADVDQIALTQDVYIDLNGHDVATVTGSATLYCMDSVTDNFDATEGWGTAPKQANVVAFNDYRKVADGFDMIEGRGKGTKYYLAFDEEGNRQSFHRLDMVIHTLNVNIGSRGISYTASFQGDAKIKENIQEFGIAMRAYNAPNATSIWADADGKTHVAKQRGDWMAQSTLTGVDVTGILDEDPNHADNAARANVVIYGACYIQFNDGTMLFSPKLGLNFNEVMNIIDQQWDDPDSKPSDEEKADLVAFYTKYESAFDSTYMENIAAEASK